MKHFLFIIAVLLAAGPVVGQTLTVKAGPSFSSLHWEIGGRDLGVARHTLTGSSTFLGLEFLNSRFIALSAHAGWIQKGGRGKYDLIFEPGDDPVERGVQRFRLDYLSAHVVLDVNIPVGERVVPFLSAGPRYDRLVGYDVIFGEIDEIGALEKNAYGLLLGAGVRYDAARWRLGLRGDNYLNAGPLAEWPAEGGNLGGKITDTTFSVAMTVGYRLAGGTE